MYNEQSIIFSHRRSSAVRRVYSIDTAADGRCCVGKQQNPKSIGTRCFPKPRPRKPQWATFLIENNTRTLAVKGANVTQPVCFKTKQSYTSLKTLTVKSNQLTAQAKIEIPCVGDRQGALCRHNKRTNHKGMRIDKYGTVWYKVCVVTRRSSAVREVPH